MACCILAAATVLVLETEAAKEGPYDFSKITYRWHRTFCNMPVPEFNQSGCTTVQPANPDTITETLLNPILPKMYIYWPNLLRPHWRTGNVSFWRYQWKKHGRCFDHPDKPFHYFNITLKYVEENNMFQKLKEVFLGMKRRGGIEPDDMGGYLGSEIAGVFIDIGELQVEIVCFKIGERLQLYELRVCFASDGTRMACPTPFKGCQESDTIWYLPP
ncbi:ribonuclease T2-like [Tripterygium wilfordii]|uniref:ribonuclease T2-like n=1 Tax=Tripterygium wilfordii TaxID=458696 RepID=UPI0018F83567|nr:ribonuclease T2-like [Tripterygium wilfordii]